MKAKELWNEIKERLVPSDTARKYLEEIGWEPSDFELAALIHRAEHASFAKERELLRRLDTKDEALAAQIKNYIHDQERLIQDVMKKEKGCIYALRINDGPMREGDNAGYYLSSQQAMAVGMWFEEPFAIHKYEPFQEETMELPDFVSRIPDDIQLTPEEFDVNQRRGCVYCAKDGAITDVWDGWPAGGHMVKDILPRPPWSFPRHPEVGDILWMERGGARMVRELEGKLPNNEDGNKKGELV